MHLYPGGSTRSPEWRAIRARIRARAGDRCEGEGCGVANHALGGRLPDGRFLPALPLGEKGLRLEWPKPGETAWCSDPLYGDGRLRIIRIVCTVAHLDGDETNSADDNLRLLCQRCHNRLDARSRAIHAAATRRAGRAAGELFEHERAIPHAE